ncbi:hypothetical protein GON09_001307 [Rhodococcus sp. B50]|nr:hypothetical protein [Rhodococcus sp. B50]
MLSVVRATIFAHKAHRGLYDRQLQRERQKILGFIDDLDSNRLTILRSLTLLQQMSLDSALIDAAHGTVDSAKIDALLEQLDAAGIDYPYLDGRTRDRGKVLEDFKSGAAPVFLISLESGGFGVNPVEADYCWRNRPVRGCGNACYHNHARARQRNGTPSSASTASANRPGAAASSPPRSTANFAHPSRASRAFGVSRSSARC